MASRRAAQLALGLGLMSVWLACSGTNGVDLGGQGEGGSDSASAGGTAGSAGGTPTAGSGPGAGTSASPGGAAGATSPEGGAGGAVSGTSGQGGSDVFGGSAGTINPQGGGGTTGGSGGMPICDEVKAAATPIPLTVYIALDRSSSLSGSKWDAAKAGLSTFLNDPVSADVSVGLVTFPRQPLLNKEQCSVENYQTPEVDFGELPGNAAKVTAFLDTVQPNGYGTPLYPALGGTLQRAALTMTQKPTENFVVLLVTDGEPATPPATCSGVDALSTDAIGALVHKAYTDFKVKTFVIGLPGIPTEFANTLAQQGGTQAILINQSLDLSSQFQSALASVRGEGLGCEYPLPPDATKYDKDKVNVTYTPGTGAPQDLGRSAGCKDGLGWDYDNDATPTKILLCGSTCTQVKKDSKAKVDVALGCPTRVVIIN